MDNILGQQFGRLMVLEVLDGDRKHLKVLAICECGITKAVRLDHLRSGSTTSCGCWNKERSGKQRIDLLGQRFGRLLVVSNPSTSTWECDCDCGKRTVRTTAQLRESHVKSCGCLYQVKAAERRRDISGQRFGKLVAIRIDEARSKPKRVKWKCKCDCGNTCFVALSDLTSDNTSSCGCGSSRLAQTHGLSGTKEMRRFWAMKRVAAKKNRTPPWVDMDAIKDIYMNVPKGYEVDHIVPLQGKLVSGLHIAENLQYLTKQDNWNKKNKFEPQFLIQDNATIRETN